MTALPVFTNRQLAIDNRQSDFPLDALPTPMRDFAAAISQSLNLDPVCIALPMLTIAGAIIGNTRRVSLTNDLSHPAALWSAILTDDDPRLPRALQILLQPLVDSQIEITRDLRARYRRHIYAVNEWHDKRTLKHEKSDENNVRPLHPVTDYKQYFFNDGGYDQIPHYLHRQPRGCLIVQNDLSQWFQSADKRFLSLFDANPHTFDSTKFLPARFTMNAFVAITGAITTNPTTTTPNSCSRRACSPYLPSRFLPTRFLLARSTQPQTKPVISDIDPALKQDWRSLLTALRFLRPEKSIENPDPLEGEAPPIQIPLINKAKTLLAKEQNRLFSAAQNQPDPNLRAHLVNLIDYIPRIALILQLAQARFDEISPGKDRKVISDRSSPHFVDPWSIACATKIIDWLTKETRQIHTAVNLDEDAQRVLTVLKIIEKQGGQITPRELMHANRFFRSSSQSAIAFLKLLAREGLGEIVTVPTKRKSKFTFKMTGNGNANFPTSDQKTKDNVTTAPPNTS